MGMYIFTITCAITCQIEPQETAVSSYETEQIKTMCVCVCVCVCVCGVQMWWTFDSLTIDVKGSDVKVSGTTVVSGMTSTLVITVYRTNTPWPPLATCNHTADDNDDSGAE